jgi:hypothetical protein
MVMGVRMDTALTMVVTVGKVAQVVQVLLKLPIFKEGE